MSDKGKKSDGSKGAALEQSGPARTPGRTTTRTVTTEVKTEVIEEKTIDHSPKPEIKDEKVETKTESAAKKSGRPKKNPESDQRGAGGDGQDKEVETSIESAPKKTGRPKKELKSDQRGAGADGQDKEAMSGKGKKSDGSKGATKEQPGPDGVEGIAKKFDSLSTKDGEATNGTPRTEAMADGGTTQKHKDFVSKPMGEKDVAEIPGIGEVSADNLRKENWIKAYQIYGQYLVLQKDKTKFKEFIQQFLTKGKKQDAACIYNAMKEYSEKVSKYVDEGFAKDRKATVPH